ncbi:hypothetical protein A2U01_0115393, partial [Trifolium medium]|nr:hypothetical protein [Trifolium medium]
MTMLRTEVWRLSKSHWGDPAMDLAASGLIPFFIGCALLLVRFLPLSAPTSFFP